MLLTSDLVITLKNPKEFQMLFQSSGKKYQMTVVGDKKDAADWVSKLKEQQKKVTKEWNQQTQ